MIAGLQTFPSLAVAIAHGFEPAGAEGIVRKRVGATYVTATIKGATAAPGSDGALHVDDKKQSVGELSALRARGRRITGQRVA